MSEDTPDFSVDPNGGMTPPIKFTYSGHQVEIVPPDADRLIGSYCQFKNRRRLRGNFLFSSARRAAEQAKRLIDGREE
jgi:hypothetical protein